MRKPITPLYMIKLSDHSKIIISSLISPLISYINNFFSGKPIAIITEKRLYSLYGSHIKKLLNLSDSLLIITRGTEKHKTRDEKERIENILLSKRFPRNGFIITFGGGIVSDIGGFVSATYLRGIPWICIPTTLLAMIDASIGGKVAVNTNYGKNLIGSFHQPDSIFINPVYLKTLNDKEMKNGLMEGIKIAVAADRNLFFFIHKNHSSILAKQKRLLTFFIKRSSQLKAYIVEKDPYENWLRAVLNAGHTVAHGIERASFYNISHGEAVAAGLMVEARILKGMGIFPKSDLHYLNDLILRIEIDKRIHRLNRNEIWKAMANDKKNRLNEIIITKIKGIGKLTKSGPFTIPIKRELFIKAWEDLIAL